HRVPQPQRFILPRVAEMQSAADFAYHLRLLRFSFRFQKTFELRRKIEMIFDGILAASGDENNVLDSGSNAFFHRVLNQRLIHHRQHFLRHGFSYAFSIGGHVFWFSRLFKMAEFSRERRVEREIILLFMPAWRKLTLRAPFVNAKT